jgi:hypothetical protein
MSILLPLYIYPWAGVWDPFYHAAETHPNVNFTVVINPCNGPCVAGVPTEPYLAEVPKLKNYTNVHTLGYVATNYSNRPIDDVLEEIRTWAIWPKANSNDKMSVDGIFFDEVPGSYEWEKYDYLQKATNEVKAADGLRQKIVVHNPGVLPGIYSNYLNLADITVVFENTFMEWLEQDKFNALASFSTSANIPKSKLAVMMHTLPNLNDDMVQWVTKELVGMVGWSFVSSVKTSGEWWHSFSSLFDGFIGHVAAG